MQIRTPKADSDAMRIVVEERNGYWTAWFADRPELAYGGRTATEAVYRLSGPAETQETWRDRPTML